MIRCFVCYLTDYYAVACTPLGCTRINVISNCYYHFMSGMEYMAILWGLLGISSIPHSIIWFRPRNSNKEQSRYSNCGNE